MKRLAPLLLALAACRSAPPAGAPALLTVYGDVPRLERAEAFLVEGAHTHAVAPENPCLTVEVDRLLRELGETAGRRLPTADTSMICSMLGDTLGGPDRLVLALRTTAGELFAVDVPRLAPGESERSFPAGVARVTRADAEGKRTASLLRGRVGLRRRSPGAYDVELFGVLQPIDAAAGPLQVVARIDTSRPER